GAREEAACEEAGRDEDERGEEARRRGGRRDLRARAGGERVGDLDERDRRAVDVREAEEEVGRLVTHVEIGGGLGRVERLEREAEGGEEEEAGEARAEVAGDERFVLAHGTQQRVVGPVPATAPVGCEVATDPPSGATLNGEHG